MLTVPSVDELLADLRAAVDEVKALKGSSAGGSMVMICECARWRVH